MSSSPDRRYRQHTAVVDGLTMAYVDEGEELRGTGLGSRLLRESEQIAAARDKDLVSLNSFS